MSAAVSLGENFAANDLRRPARASRDAGQSRRLLALAAVNDGGSRTEAARIGAVGLQTVRDWVLAFHADGPAGLIDHQAPGNRPKLNAVPWLRRNVTTSTSGLSRFFVRRGITRKNGLSTRLSRSGRT